MPIKFATLMSIRTVEPRATWRHRVFRELSPGAQEPNRPNYRGVLGFRYTQQCSSTTMKASTTLCFTASTQALWGLAPDLSTSMTSLQGTSFVSTTNISALPPRTTTLTSQKPSGSISHSASNFTLPPSTPLSGESCTLMSSQTPGITATTSTTSQPTQTIEPGVLGEIETTGIHERRLSAIIGALTDASSISAWSASVCSLHSAG